MGPTSAYLTIIPKEAHIDLQTYLKTPPSPKKQKNKNKEEGEGVKIDIILASKSNQLICSK